MLENSKLPPSEAQGVLGALAKSDLTAALAQLAALPDLKLLNGLLGECIKVAILQKNIAALRILSKQVARLSKETYHNHFIDIIQGLVTDIGDEVAIGIAVSVVTANVRQHKNLHRDSLWYELMSLILAAGKTEEIDGLYPYLEQAGEQYKITAGMLNQVALETQPHTWFEWFARYLNSAPAYSPLWEVNYEKQARDYLQSEDDITPYIEAGITETLSEKQQTFIIEFYLMCVAVQAQAKLKVLDAHIPEHLRWLLNFNLAITDIEAIAVFNHSALEYRYQYEASLHKILELILDGLWMREEGSCADKLLSCVDSVVSKAPVYREKTIEYFLTACCEKGKYHAACRIFRKYVDVNSWKFNERAAQLLGGKLSPDDYRHILAAQRDWPDDLGIIDDINARLSKGQRVNIQAHASLRDTLSILLKIPIAFVHAEDDRRKKASRRERQAKQNQLVKLSDQSVSERGVHYESLYEEIQLLLRERRLPFALKLIRKIVGSKYRDALLINLLMLAWQKNNMQLAAEASQLFKHQSVHWVVWPTRFNEKNHVGVLKWLADATDFQNVKILVAYYVSRVFAKKDFVTVMQWLIDAGFFAGKKLDFKHYYENKMRAYYLPKSSDAPSTEVEDDIFDDDISAEALSVSSGPEQDVLLPDLEETILMRFIAFAEKNNNAMVTLAHLKQKGVEGVGPAIIFYYLRRKQWQRATELINLFMSDDKALTDNLFKQGISHNDFLDTLPSILLHFLSVQKVMDSDVLNFIAQIKHMELRARALYVWLQHIELEIKPSQIAQVRAIYTVINAFQDRAGQYELYGVLYVKIHAVVGDQAYIIFNQIIANAICDPLLQRKLFVKHVLASLVDNKALLKLSDILYLHQSDDGTWYALAEAIVCAHDGGAFHALDAFNFLLKNIEAWHEDVAQGPEVFRRLIKFLIDKSLGTYARAWHAAAIIREHYPTLCQKAPVLSYVMQGFHTAAMRNAIESATSSPVQLENVVYALQRISKESDSQLTISVSSQDMEALIGPLIQAGILTNNVDIMVKIFGLIRPILTQYNVNALKSDILDALKYYADICNSDPCAMLCLSLCSIRHYQSWRCWSEHMFKPFCLDLFANGQVEKALILIAKTNRHFADADSSAQSTYAEYRMQMFITAAVQAAQRRATVLVEQIYDAELTSLPLDRLAELIRASISTGELAFAKKIVDNAQSEPAKQLTWRKEISSAYFRRLQNMTSPTIAASMKQLYVDYTYMLIKTASNKSTISPQLQNKLIVDIVTLLDTAFSAYYQSIYNRDHPQCANHTFKFPAPVDDHFKGTQLADKLTGFYSVFNFKPVDPLLTKFLLAVQPDPAKNTAYAWLRHFRRQRNASLHQGQPQPVPGTHGCAANVSIDFAMILPQVEHLLLKLFNLSMPMKNLKTMSFDNLTSLAPDNFTALAHCWGIDLPSLPINGQSAQVSK